MTSPRFGYIKLISRLPFLNQERRNETQNSEIIKFIIVIKFQKWLFLNCGFRFRSVANFKFYRSQMAKFWREKNAR